MKKIYFTLCTILFTISLSAQTVKVYKGNAITPIFQIADADSVVFVENSILEPGKPCKLLAVIAHDNNRSNSLKQISPINPDANIVLFKWDEGDTVVIANASGKETFVATKVYGDTAELEGLALTDMSNYHVYYGFDHQAASQVVTYKEKSFNPNSIGNGQDTTIMIDTFYPVILLYLKGVCTLGKIEYYIDSTLRTTLAFPDGMALKKDSSKEIYIPLASVSETGFTLKFYDNATTPAFIMEQSSKISLIYNTIYVFPELLIQAK